MVEFDVTTESDLAPEQVWAALTDFSEDRPTLWPFIHPPLYRVHSVEAGAADVQEGTRTPLGKVWAREHYTWDDDVMVMRATVAESNIFEVGGTGVFTVRPRDGGGSVLHEEYQRTRIGLRGKLMDRLMGPSRIQSFIGGGRQKTYDAIRARDAG